MQRTGVAAAICLWVCLAQSHGFAWETPDSQDEQLYGTRGVEERAATSHFERARCFVPLPPQLVEGVSCGFVTVPESYDRHGPTIRLAVLIADAIDDRGLPPVLYLRGGPGNPAIPDAPSVLASDQGIGAVRATRALIFLDQRGTGFSQPALSCPELGGLDDVLPADLATQLRGIRACRDRLRAQGIDLSAYNTDFNSRDLERVRQALGFTRVSLYGVSYAAKLGLHRMRGTPVWLESALLQSGLDPLHNAIAEGPRLYQRSLDALDDACAAQPRCLQTYGHVRAQLDRVIADLAANPREMTFINPYTGEPTTFFVTPEILSMNLFLMLYFTELIPFLPDAIARAASGSYDGLGWLALLLDGDPTEQPDAEPLPGRSTGMNYSVMCAEEIARSSRAQMRGFARGTDRIVADYFLPRYLRWYDWCEAWDVPHATPLLTLPVVSRTRTYLTAGEFDPVTPASYAQGISRFLLNDQVTTVAFGSHVPLDAAEGCGTELITTFFAEPGTRLDDRCAQLPVAFWYAEQSQATQMKLAVQSPAARTPAGAPAFAAEAKARIAAYAGRRSDAPRRWH